jgi:anti-sigma factor RsiW
MNPCQQFKEYMFDLLDHEIDNLRKKQLLDHFDDCPRCDRLMARLKALQSHLSSLEPVRANEDFHIVLRQRLRREMAGRRRWSTSTLPGYVKWTPAVGIAAAALIIGLLVSDQQTRSPDGELSGFRTAASVADPSQGQVQYVIDDYPQRISVSRNDRIDSRSNAGSDSVRQRNNFDQVRSRVTPVSF